MNLSVICSKDHHHSKWVLLVYEQRKKSSSSSSFPSLIRIWNENVRTFNFAAGAGTPKNLLTMVQQWKSYSNISKNIISGIHDAERL